MTKNSGEIEAVFEHWKEVMSSPRSRLDIKRRDAIKGRLIDGYTLADLCDAINGCRASRFHMGDNDRRRVFNDIGLICRDAEHVDRFIEEWEAVKRKAESVEQKRADAGKSVGDMSPEERQAMSANIRNILKVARG